METNNQKQTRQDILLCVGQKAFINRNGKILVLDDPEDGIDFPGGKIQEGEPQLGNPTTLKDALQREVEEETGLNIEVGDPFTVWYYEYPSGHRNYPKKVYLVGFKCNYISGEIKLSSEHDKLMWVDKSDYAQLEDGSDYYKALEKYFES